MFEPWSLHSRVEELAKFLLPHRQKGYQRQIGRGQEATTGGDDHRRDSGDVEKKMQESNLSGRGEDDDEKIQRGP